MKGMIKFYNKDKGFGFVVGENNQDYYFNQKVIPFGHIPTSGDMIEFEVSDKPTSNKHKEPTIAKMTMTGEQATDNKAIQPFRKTNHYRDNRITCPHCYKKITPKIYYLNQAPYRSYCPFCGEMVKDFQGAKPQIEFILFLLAIPFVILSIYLIANPKALLQDLIGTSLLVVPFILFGLVIFFAKKYNRKPH